MIEEKKLLEILAKNPEIKTSDVYWSSEWNKIGFVTGASATQQKPQNFLQKFLLDGTIQQDLFNIHNLIWWDGKSKHCVQILPLVIFEVVKGKTNIKNKQISLYDFEPYAKGFNEGIFNQVNSEYFFLNTKSFFGDHNPSMKELFGKNARDVKKEMLKISSKIKHNDTIKFGELVTLQAYMNKIEQPSFKQIAKTEYNLEM